jgi:hypothetical protein
MFRHMRFLVASLWLCAVSNGAHVACAQDNLSVRLRELDQLRNGNRTALPFDEVESLGKALLNEYTKPEEQGQIYYHLAAVHGQSIDVHTDLVIKYAQDALALPVEPLQRLRLYVYWGDAIRTANMQKPHEKQRPFHEVRRAAAKPYLQGLKEMQKYDIPEKLPELPAVGRYDISGDQNSLQVVEAKKEHADQIAARTDAQSSRRLWMNRDVLTRQVVDMYSRPPFAATELRDLATKILNKPEQVNALMKRIEEKGALKDDPIPEMADTAARNK